MTGRLSIPIWFLYWRSCFRVRAMSQSGSPREAWDFAFFAVLLALLSWYTTTPERSFIGRAAGGLFVWALSIPDAYKLARIRYNAWMKRNRSNS